MEHKACGWTLPSRAVGAAVPQPSVAAPNLERAPDPEGDARRRRQIEELKAKLREAVTAKVRRVAEQHRTDEVTPGHGRCFCELCFPKRVRRSYAAQQKSGDETSGQSGE